MAVGRGSKRRRGEVANWNARERDGGIHIYVYTQVRIYACRKGAKSIVDKCKDCSRTILREGMMIPRIDSRGVVVNAALEIKREKGKRQRDLFERKGECNTRVSLMGFVITGKFYSFIPLAIVQP